MAEKALAALEAGRLPLRQAERANVCRSIVSSRRTQKSEKAKMLEGRGGGRREWFAVLLASGVVDVLCRPEVALERLDYSINNLIGQS